MNISDSLRTMEQYLSDNLPIYRSTHKNYIVVLVTRNGRITPHFFPQKRDANMYLADIDARIGDHLMKDLKEPTLKPLA